MSTTVELPGRVVVVEEDGKLYAPIQLPDGGYADPALMREWAVTPCAAPLVTSRFIAMDEGELAGNHPGHRLNMAGLRRSRQVDEDGLWLVCPDLLLTVALVHETKLEEPGAIPDTTGWTLTLTATTRPTVLGAIYADAIRTGTLDALSLGLDAARMSPFGKRILAAEVSYATLVSRAGACCPASRLLSWEWTA